MKTMVLTLAGLILSTPAFANPVYFKGQQPVGVAGETTACFMEAEFSNAGHNVKLRSLVADAHDGELIGIGPIETNFDAQAGGYYLKSADQDARVQELLLSAANLEAPETLAVTILDGSHADSLQCQSLTAAAGAELTAVQEKFEHFADYVEEDDHDHDDGHDHDHGHDHEGHDH